MTMADYLIGIGITIAGVGIQLRFQGQALRMANKTRGLGNGAFVIGSFWAALGLIAMFFGSWDKWGFSAVVPEAIIILAVVVYSAIRKRQHRALMI